MKKKSKKLHEQKLKHKSIQLEIMKQYAIQVEVSNYYKQLFYCNNIKLYLVSLILACHDHFHFDHFYMMLKNSIRQPEITFQN